MSAAVADPIADAVARWRGVRRLLALRLDGLGDVLMTTPALQALRRGLPGAHITLMAAPGSAVLAPHLPMVDRLWGFAAPWMPGDADEPLQALGDLGGAGFDAAVIFTVCTQSALPAALWCRLGGIPLRLAASRENPYGLLTDWQPETDTVGSDMRHEVQRQLDLVARVGFGPAVADDAHDRLRFQVLPADRRRIAEKLAAAGVAPAARYAVLHPGATASSRRWPAERFGAVAAELAQRAPCAVVLAGGPHDEAALQQASAALAAAAPDVAAVAAVFDALPLGELAALVEGAALLVANNSLPSHLAAAVGTPVVTLYALTNPQHTPWRVPAHVVSHDVPCRWCLKSRCPQLHHACLQEVGVERTAAAALDLLHRTRSIALTEAAA